MPMIAIDWLGGYATVYISCPRLFLPEHGKGETV
jgi:hypothetical protein